MRYIHSAIAALFLLTTACTTTSPNLNDKTLGTIGKSWIPVESLVPQMYKEFVHEEQRGFVNVGQMPEKTTIHYLIVIHCPDVDDTVFTFYFQHNEDVGESTSCDGTISKHNTGGNYWQQVVGEPPEAFFRMVQK